MIDDIIEKVRDREFSTLDAAIREAIKLYEESRPARAYNVQAAALVTDEMARALVRKHRDLYPGSGWPKLEDARALVSAALKPPHPAPLDAERVREAAIREAAQIVSKRRDQYVQEHGSYDPSTGVTEFPGYGEELVLEWDEIEEEILAALRQKEGKA